MKHVITTERLVFRPVESEDFEAIHEYASDPELFERLPAELE